MASDVPTTSVAQEATTQHESSNKESTSGPVTEEIKPDRPVNDNPPSASDLHKVENHTVLDNKGEAHTFKSIYGGPDSAKRVLVVFIRHFFCGVGLSRAMEWNGMVSDCIVELSRVYPRPSAVVQTR